MKFGRVRDAAALDAIEFSLPGLDDEEEKAQLSRIERAARRRGSGRHPTTIRVGLPIFSEPRWIGRLYPPGTASGQFLEEYAKAFGVVEVSSTFYALPPIEQLTRWRNSSGREFRFIPKFPASISRSIGRRLDLRDLEPFLERVEALQPKLAQTFIQLPPDRGRSALRDLEILLASLPRGIHPAVEFRHPSFFRGQRLLPDVIDLLAEHRSAAVITDTAGFRELAHVSVSSLRTLIRFAASDGHPSDRIRLSHWAARIARWHQAGMQQIDMTIHAEDPIAEIELASSFVELLNQALLRQGSALQIPVPRLYHRLQTELF
ncbi:MAG: DUF72 domain-containing protein [Sandaracinaceae bacterium]|nr:DUF72 domain-containing protein [Sandaracinaceae bacterium]